MRGLHSSRSQPAATGSLTLVTLAFLLAGSAGAGPTETTDTSGQPASARTTRTASPRNGLPPGWGTTADPRRFLPGSGAIPGWLPAEEPRVFNGKTLFAHIDGGAEEFLAQGFRALGVGGYRKDSLEVVAEIYDLGTRKGATAILDARGGTPPFEGRPRGESVSNPARPDSAAGVPPAVGEACVLDTMQVIFRRGRFYIAVTGFEARPEVTAALRVLADSIDARIRAAGGSPAGK
jgi:hypothetical protein